jgi:hypothetical protein
MGRNHSQRVGRLVKRRKHALLSRLLTNRYQAQPVSVDSLLKYANNITSQIGQDGIINEISRRIGIQNGFFIEFGAWDGIHLSNCRQLYLNGWKGIFIEGSEKRFLDLVDNYKDSKIVLINEFVAPSNNASGHVNGRTLIKMISEHLSASEITEIDMVGIDIDGADLEVALSIGFSPKFMVIEGGTLINPNIDNPYPDAFDNSQHPLTYAIRMLRETGYQPVCFHQDLYVVRNDLASNVHARAFELNAQELYFDSLAVRGKDFLTWLVSERLNDSRIKKFEIAQMGKFDANPLRSRMNSAKLS